MDSKAGTYRRMIEGDKDTYQVSDIQAPLKTYMRVTLFLSDPIRGFCRKEEDRRRFDLVLKAIKHKAPSVVFHKLHGNDFQCGVPPACKMVTAQEFGFPVKIMRLLPHVCDDAPVLELDCKEEKEEAMHVEKSMVVEKPAS